MLGGILKSREGWRMSSSARSRCESYTTQEVWYGCCRFFQNTSSKVTQRRVMVLLTITGNVGRYEHEDLDEGEKDGMSCLWTCLAVVEGPLGVGCGYINSTSYPSPTSLHIRRISMSLKDLEGNDVLSWVSGVWNKTLLHIGYGGQLPRKGFWNTSRLWSEKYKT